MEASCPPACRSPLIRSAGKRLPSRAGRWKTVENKSRRFFFSSGQPYRRACKAQGQPRASARGCFCRGELFLAAPAVGVSPRRARQSCAVSYRLRELVLPACWFGGAAYLASPRLQPGGEPRKNACRSPPPANAGGSPFARISVCSGFGAEAPAQVAWRKPQADTVSPRTHVRGSSRLKTHDPRPRH